MEGDGPGVSGTPRHVGGLPASASPLAVDLAAGEIMGLPHEQNPVLAAAERRGLFPRKPDDIEVVGADLAAIRIPDYVFPSTVEGIGLSRGNTGFHGKVYHTLLTQYQSIIKRQCAGCGVCHDSCPQKAITMTGSGGQCLIRPAASAVTVVMNSALIRQWCKGGKRQWKLPI